MLKFPNQQKFTLPVWIKKIRYLKRNKPQESADTHKYLKHVYTVKLCCNNLSEITNTSAST